MSDTPETDATANPLWGDAQELCLLRELARKLERERNEAREDAKRATYNAAQETIKVSTVKSHWIEACRERDEAREALREVERENDQLLASNKNYERDWPVLVHERDEAIAARKSSAADWLSQVEQANSRTSRALQQVALAEREHKEARAECERLNRLLRHETALGQGDIDHYAALERERDEAREQNEEQARLLAMSADREEKLRTELQQARDCFSAAMELAERYKAERDAMQ